MIYNVIKAYHDEMAHCGAKKTFHRCYIATYWFLSLRKRIKDHIDNCLICLMANASRNEKEDQMQFTPIPRKSLEILYVDHFDPLQQMVDNFKYFRNSRCL